MLSRGHASRAFCCLYSRNLASATGSSGLGVAVSRFRRSTDDVLPRTVGTRAEPRAVDARFSRDGRRACSKPGGPAVATGGRAGRRPDGPATVATPTPAGATIPGGADGGGATPVEPDGPAALPPPFVDTGAAGARGGSGDDRAAAVDRGPGADPSPTGATADNDAVAAAGDVAAPGEGPGDDAAGPRRTVE